MTEKNSENNPNTNLDNATNFLTSTTTTTTAQARSEAWFVLSPEVIVNVVFFLLLTFIIVSTNLLVLASVYANSRLQRPTYFMIVSLSAADLIVGLVLLPARLVELLFFEWTKQFVWCKMTSSLSLFSLSASLLNLLAFTLDRFLAIFYALKYRTVMTPNKLLVTIAVVWLAAFLASFLPVFGVGTRPENTYRVTRLCRLADTLDERYMAVYFVFVCAVPTVLISGAHSKIFLLARSHERRIASLRISNERSTKLARGSRPVILARDSKAAKTIGEFGILHIRDYGWHTGMWSSVTLSVSCSLILSRKIGTSKMRLVHNWLMTKGSLPYV